MLRETISLLQLILGPLPDQRNHPNPGFYHMVHSAPRTTLFGLLAEGDLGYMRRTSYRPGLPPLTARSTVPLPLHPVEEYTDFFVRSHYRTLRNDPAFSQVFPLIPAGDPHLPPASPASGGVPLLPVRPAPYVDLVGPPRPPPRDQTTGLPPGPSGDGSRKRPRQDET